MHSTQKNIVSAKPQNINARILSTNSERIAEGGLRLKCQYKKSTPDKPLITIVTVVFNGEFFIEETILSVLNQTYDNIEYIIIDGGSNDRTTEIIKRYECAIDYWLSQPDQGIYDAMNKGAKLANGKYLHFLNASDSYYNKDVLNKISPTFKSKYSIIIGAAEFIYTDSQKVIKEARLNTFQMPNCHQSCFYLTVQFQNRYYSLRYKILADFDYWINEYVLNKANVIIIDDVVCCYDMNGISNTLIFKSLKEKFEIFNSTHLLKYKVLGPLDVLIDFIKIILAKSLQKIGLRAALVRLKLFLFRR